MIVSKYAIALFLFFLLSISVKRFVDSQDVLAHL